MHYTGTTYFIEIPELELDGDTLDALSVLAEATADIFLAGSPLYLKRLDRGDAERAKTTDAFAALAHNYTTPAVEELPQGTPMTHHVSHVTLHRTEDDASFLSVHVPIARYFLSDADDLAHALDALMTDLFGKALFRIKRKRGLAIESFDAITADIVR